MIYFIVHPLIAISAAFALIALILGWFIYDLHRKWRRMFGRRTSPAAGGALGEALERMVKVERRLDSVEPRLDTLETIGQIAVQKVGFLRFNPFADTGGDQSFALALLDRENNGLVLSSLYTREGVRVYAKEIKNGSSTHQLSGEEKKVLEQAMKTES